MELSIENQSSKFFRTLSKQVLPPLFILVCCFCTERATSTTKIETCKKWQSKTISIGIYNDTTIAITSYTFDDHENLIREDKITLPDSSRYSKIYTYTLFDSIESITIINNDSSYHAKEFYIYNEHNLLKMYVDLSKTGDTTIVQNYDYNSKKQLVTTIAHNYRSNTSGYLIHEYNDLGQKTKISNFNQSDSLLWTLSSEYNEYGLLIYSIGVSSSNAVMNKYLYTYDSNRNLVHYEMLDGNGRKIRWKYYEYDIKGNLTNLVQGENIGWPSGDIYTSSETEYIFECE